MKLAEALILRADLDKSITEIKERIVANSLVQEGTVPAEDPETLLKEFYKKIDEHEELVVKINVTNLQVKIENGATITSAIAKRDSLKRLYGILKAVTEHASSSADRYSRKEILNVSTVDVASIRKKMDKTAEQMRKVDIEIQAANWTNDLIE